MVKDLSEVRNMTDKEIMYVVASEYIDDVCFEAVNEAEEIMSNDIVRNMLCQSAEAILCLRKMREKIAISNTADSSYNLLASEVKAYRTVLHNCLFYKYSESNPTNI